MEANVNPVDEREYDVALEDLHAAIEDCDTGQLEALTAAEAADVLARHERLAA
jgi:hypothetical protein